MSTQRAGAGNEVPARRGVSGGRWPRWVQGFKSPVQGSTGLTVMHHQNSKPVRAKPGQIGQGSPRCAGRGGRSMGFETQRGHWPRRFSQQKKKPAPLSAAAGRTPKKPGFRDTHTITSRKLPDFRRHTRKDTSRKTGGPLFQNTLRKSTSPNAPPSASPTSRNCTTKSPPRYSRGAGGRVGSRPSYTQKNSPTLSADAGRGRRRDSPRCATDSGPARPHCPQIPLPIRTQNQLITDLMHDIN